MFRAKAALFRVSRFSRNANHAARRLLTRVHIYPERGDWMAAQMQLKGPERFPAWSN
jgi:hypothetical protein